MGSSKSKPTVEHDESKNKMQMSDSSSGLHLFEIHSPTVGASVMMVIFIVAVCAGLWYICHRLRHSRRLRGECQGVNQFLLQILRAQNPVVSAMLHGMQQGLQMQLQQQQNPLLALGQLSASDIIDAGVV